MGFASRLAGGLVKAFARIIVSGAGLGRIRKGGMERDMQLFKDILDRKVKGALDEETLNKIGQIMVEGIKAKTRKGLGADNKKLPILEISTIRKRGYLARFNKTGKAYKQGKSNITFSGKLLESLTYKVDKGSGTVRIVSEGMHPGYKSGPKGKRGPRVSNDEITRHLIKKGFSYVGILNDKKILALISKVLNKKLGKKGK